MVREQILGVYGYTFTTADEEKGKERESLQNYRITSVSGGIEQILMTYG